MTTETPTDVIIEAIRNAAAAEVSRYATQDSYRRMGIAPDDLTAEDVTINQNEAAVMILKTVTSQTVDLGSSHSGEA